MIAILGIGCVMLIAPICIGITLYYSAKETKEIGRSPKDG